MRDQEQIIVEQQFDYMESWCVSFPLGFRKHEETLMPFAEWFYPLHLAAEYTRDELDDKAKLDGLHFYRKVHVEDSTLYRILESIGRSVSAVEGNGSLELNSSLDRSTASLG